MRWMLWTAVALALPPMAGCGNGQQGSPATTAADAEPQVSMPAALADQAAIEQALAKLSPEDRALAEKQKICLVSGEPLGSMGVPEWVEVKGQRVLICCDGCLEALHENPDEYLRGVEE